MTASRRNFDKINKRRIFLIMKRFKEGLSQGEEDELAILVHEYRKLVNILFPRPIRIPLEAIDHEQFDILP